MKKILIAGANGYIGARLSKLFALNGYSVTGICFPKIPNDLKWQNYFTKLYQLDLRDSGAIEKISNDYYDVLINLVSLDHNQSEGEPNFVTSVNVVPTLNLLKNFAKKKTLKKFIYFSTVQVYGELPNENISENKRPMPKNIYGLTHYLSEQICNYFQINSEIDCISIRLSNSYGSPIFTDNNCWWLVVNDLCKSAFYDRRIVLKSDGSPQRDFIHGDDIFNALECLISTEADNGLENVFHISSGETLTILELAHKVKKVFSRNLKIDIPIDFSSGVKSDKENPQKFPKYKIDNNKIKKLGYEQKVSIESGIQELFDYFK